MHVFTREEGTGLGNNCPGQGPGVLHDGFDEEPFCNMGQTISVSPKLALKKIVKRIQIWRVRGQ